MCVGKRKSVFPLFICHVPLSPYFYAMFKSDALESRQNSITLKSMYPKSMELLIEFAYTAQIRITEGNVHATSKSVSLKKKLVNCDFIQWQLAPSNCIGIKGLFRYLWLFGFKSSSRKVYISPLFTSLKVKNFKPCPKTAWSTQ